MTAKQRVRKTISLTSPEGKKFDGKWIGDERSLEKKVALFDFVNVRGTVAQDLLSKSRKYPLTIMFDGPDHDTVSDEFFNELDRGRNTWEILHPKKGWMELQPLSAREDVQPVRSANSTTFTVEWMEPIDPETLLTGAQMAAIHGEHLNEFNELSAEQFNDNVTIGTIADRDAFTSETKNLLQKIKAGTKNLTGAVTDIQERMDATQIATEALLDEVILEPLMIAGSIQMLIQTPAMAIDSIEDRLKMYGDLATELFVRENDRVDNTARIQSAVKEVGLVAIVGAYSRIGFTGRLAGEDKAGSPTLTGDEIILRSGIVKTVNGGVQTKNDIDAIMRDIEDKVKEIDESLDKDQAKYRDEPLQWQFFSQSKSFYSGWFMTVYTLKYLQKYFYSAVVEKRFILKTPKTPIRVCIDKYGSLGDDDQLLDLFYASNEISGDEIFLLQTGREVVIYG